MKLSITGTHAPSATSLSYTSLTWGHYLAKGVDSTRYHTIYSNNNEYFVIRRATFEDRDALCKVCLETGDSGADATTMYEDKHILGDRWVMPYVEHEPQLAFVLVNPLTKHVIGYALGCIDTTKFEDFMEINYLPRMQIKYSKKEGLRSVHDTIYRDDNVTHDFHNFHRTPDSVCNHESYSSHLHIDIIPQYQGQGLGKPLLSYLLRQVRNHRETSTGIFLEMSGANSRARGFYKSLGFQQLLIVNESTKDIISSSTWKFNPSNTSTSHAVALDASVIIYMGMSLSSGEKGCVLTSSGTVWNPLRLVRYGHNMLASFIADTLSREGHEGTLRNILVCTAPEPWELLKDSVANALGATGDVSGRVTCYMVTSMDERLLLSDLNEWQKKHYTLVVGIGGGSACDYAKYMCDALDLPLVLVPSILSVDAPFTRAAGIRVVNGGRTSVRYVGDVADRLVGLLIDFSLLRGAPQQLNKAGVGDVLSIATGLWDWREASRRQGERFSVDIARDALVVLNNLLNSSSELSSCSEAGLCSLVVAFCGEVTLCEQWGNSRSEEGSEHYLAYALESKWSKTGGYLHGRLIGLCSVIVSLLQEAACPYVDSSRRKKVTEQSTKEELRVALSNSRVAFTLSSFFKNIGFDCSFGPVNGNPSRDQVAAALAGIDSFLQDETQLLPGYFHFFGSPSELVIDVVLDLTEEMTK